MSGRMPTASWGPIYGKQWRSWEGAGGAYGRSDHPTDRSDQSDNPTAGGSSSAPGMWPTCPIWPLMPCHAIFQFYVCGREAELSALPAQRRCLPGCSLQYCLLCPADPDDRAGMPAGTGAISSILSETYIYTAITWSRPRLQLTRDPVPPACHEAQTPP